MKILKNFLVVDKRSEMIQKLQNRLQFIANNLLDDTHTLHCGYTSWQSVYLSHKLFANLCVAGREPRLTREGFQAPFSDLPETVFHNTRYLDKIYENNFSCPIQLLA